MRAWCWLLMAMSVGCGSDGGSEPTEGVALDEAVSIDDIPVGDPRCPTGGVRVAVGTAQRFVCNGQPGAAGAPGVAGPAGPVGTAGIKPKASVLCGKLAIIPSGVAVSLQHSVVLFTDNSVFVTCQASSANLGTGASHSEFYSSSQVGASTLGCNVTLDPSPPSNGGYWQFALVNNAVRVTYNDSSSPTDNGTAYTFAPADCAATTLP